MANDSSTGTGRAVDGEDDVSRGCTTGIATGGTSPAGLGRPTSGADIMAFGPTGWASDGASNEGGVSPAFGTVEKLCAAGG